MGEIWKRLLLPSPPDDGDRNLYLGLLPAFRSRVPAFLDRGRLWSGTLGCAEHLSTNGRVSGTEHPAACRSGVCGGQHGMAWHGEAQPLFLFPGSPVQCVLLDAVLRYPVNRLGLTFCSRAD